MSTPELGPVTTLALAAEHALAERSGLRVTLIQARNADDPARDHEHACFAARMGLHPDQVACVSIFEVDLTTIDLDATDAVLVGGAGQYSVLDDLDSVRDFVRYTAWLATSDTTHDVPVFASCFGFQAMVLGMGGVVIEDEANAEVGSYELTVKPNAAADPLFGALPTRFVGQLGHKDRADALPAGLLDLARSERAPFQAVRVLGRPQVATQFHPELAAADNRSRFVRYMPEYGKLFGQEAAQERLDSHVPGIESSQLLERFTTLYVEPRSQARGERR